MCKTVVRVKWPAQLVSPPSSISNTRNRHFDSARNASPAKPQIALKLMRRSPTAWKPDFHAQKRLKVGASISGAEMPQYVMPPPNLSSTPAPVVFVFPGSSANAEAAAFYYTHTRFEELADRGASSSCMVMASRKRTIPMVKCLCQKGASCLLVGCNTAEEGFDVTYVRMILSQLEAELPIDRSRIYATGLSQGGGMAFQLALEAPDLVAAIAPVAPVPFQPSGPWLHFCNPQPGFDRISIAMLAATGDRFIAYSPGGTPLFSTNITPEWDRRGTRGSGCWDFAGRPRWTS